MTQGLHGQDPGSRWQEGTEGFPRGRLCSRAPGQLGAPAPTPRSLPAVPRVRKALRAPLLGIRSPFCRSLRSLISSCSHGVPLLGDLGKKTADFATLSPRKSPSTAGCYASRTQDCELEIVSPLSPPGRSLELGETAERYKWQRRRGEAPLTPDGLPDSYPFPWQKISFCYCWLGRSTEECARIYCPMHDWPNCLRNPSSRTFHRWL